MKRQREVERTYAAHPGAPLPDLASLPGVVRVGAAEVDELVAAYFDTADLALTRAGVSLRRRSGGADEGWHLKLPVDGGRDEVRLPLSRAREHPPAELRRAVVAWARKAPLHRIAVVETRRTRCDLVAGDGTVLAEVADDDVTGTPEGSQGPVSWREWEVELVEGPSSLLDAADELMGELGVEPSEVQRKILRVLGARVPVAAPLPEVGPDLAAGRVLHLWLHQQVAELHRRDCQVRLGQDEGVHQARVACRRLRSALATYRPLVDREITDELRDEIRWLGRALGDARDAKVVRERLRGLVEDEPPAGVIGPVRSRLDATYDDRARQAWSSVEDVLSSERYLALLERLDRLVADPPWTEKAALPAAEILPRRVRKDWRRLSRRVRGLAQAEDIDRELHQVRKDAKRVRYAAEALVPVFDGDAKRLAKAARKLTSHLGERQDTMLSRPDLREIGRAADAAGESSMTWGLLLGREQQRTAELDRELPDLWRRASRKKLRRWLP